MRQSHAQTGDQLRTMLLFAQGAIHLMSFTTSEVSGWVGQGEEGELEGRIEEPEGGISSAQCLVFKIEFTQLLMILD